MPFDSNYQSAGKSVNMLTVFQNTPGIANRFYDEVSKPMVELLSFALRPQTPKHIFYIRGGWSLTPAPSVMSEVNGCKVLIHLASALPFYRYSIETLCVIIF
jgi:hypothetical protein